MIDPYNDPRLPENEPLASRWAGSLTFLAGFLAVLALIALFTYGGTDRPVSTTAMNEQNAPIQTIPQQGTEPAQPVQPGQPAPPAGGDTTQP